MVDADWRWQARPILHSSQLAGAAKGSTHFRAERPHHTRLPYRTTRMRVARRSDPYSIAGSRAALSWKFVAGIPSPLTGARAAEYRRRYRRWAHPLILSVAS